VKFESRSNGVLLHISSLPNHQGIGTFGQEAYDFIDFLNETNCGIWQICPLGPTGYGDSPYQCFSAFAGNPFFIDLEKLIEIGLLTNEDVNIFDTLPVEKVDYGRLIPMKNEILKKAFQNFNHSPEFNTYCTENSFWLDDYTMFMALKEHHDGHAWSSWPEEIKLRNRLVLERYGNILAESIEYYKFLQFSFFQQWQKINDYAKQKGITILGDMPIFVAMDSADAWANPEFFYFDEQLNPTIVAGVPPDYFSPTGQLWGNPLYNWEKMKETNFAWWKDRFRHSLAMYDLIRVDHFRGFSGYWAVPVNEETAENGSWQPALGEGLFSELQKAFADLPILAEDLGVITDDVIALRDKFGFPGMKILQFAFDGGRDNPYLPQNYIENCVAYTGTHDNETTLGWFNKLSPDKRKQITEFLECQESEVAWKMIEVIWKSKAIFSISPLQDFLQLGSEARFNTPGQAAGNWQWRLQSHQINESLKLKIKDLNEKWDR
jgi:4-alpha-glucanotransferase